MSTKIDTNPREETVEQFLARGGRVERIEDHPPSRWPCSASRSARAPTAIRSAPLQPTTPLRGRPGRGEMRYSHRRLCALPVLLALGLGIVLSVLPIIAG
jgi:hypothetical protein